MLYALRSDDRHYPPIMVIEQAFRTSMMFRYFSYFHVCPRCTDIQYTGVLVSSLLVYWYPVYWTDIQYTGVLISSILVY